MKIIKIKSDTVYPSWVIKTLKGCKKTSPYVFKAMNEFAMDNLGDLAAWCQKNGSPQSKVINTTRGRFIKIADPLCRELELANIVEDGCVAKSDVKVNRKVDASVDELTTKLKAISKKVDEAQDLIGDIYNSWEDYLTLPEVSKKRSAVLVSFMFAKGAAENLAGWLTNLEKDFKKKVQR